MCGNKHRYDMGYEHSRYYSSRKPWHMSWIPFAVILVFVVGFHSWGFQPWMFWWPFWMFGPAVGIMISSFYSKTRRNVLYSAKTRTQEIPQQTYERSYENAIQETYTEGGQNFPYPQQQVQQRQYDEPHVDYPQMMPPM